jgi:hypothetical protein
MGLFTDEELITKIKSLMTELDDAVTSSELDTSQSKHSFKVSIRSQREQLERYLTMLKNQNPTCYYEFNPPSVIDFGSSGC